MNIYNNRGESDETMEQSNSVKVLTVMEERRTIYISSLSTNDATIETHGHILPSNYHQQCG